MTLAFCMLHCVAFFFIFSNGILHQAVAPNCCVALGSRDCHHPRFKSSVSWTRIRTPPPLDFVQPNTALDFFVPRPHVRLPQVSVGRTSGSSTPTTKGGRGNKHGGSCTKPTIWRRRTATSRADSRRTGGKLTAHEARGPHRHAGRTRRPE